MYNVSVAAKTTLATERGWRIVDGLFTFIILVSAEVLSHLIKKWIDKRLDNDASANNNVGENNADNGQQNGR